MTAMPPEQQALPTPPRDSLGHGTRGEHADEAFDHALELRLMHEWTAYASKSLSTAWEFWCYQAPLLALEYRYVMDALLAVSALHASRRPPSQWISLEGRMVPIKDPMCNRSNVDRGPTDRWKVNVETLETYNRAASGKAEVQYDSEAKRSLEMLAVSRQYFDRAIDGHRKALTDLTADNIESVYVTSILISFNALFTLSEDDKDPILPSFWLRLASGTRLICNRWQQLVGDRWILSSGVFYGKPDMSDNDELFKREHGKPFEKLLTWAQGDEIMDEEDRDTYEKALSYLGLIYRGIHDGSDHPMATCRRLVAMPSRLPLRFAELVESKQPRAMAILAYALASMKLREDEVLWFRGVAQRQVPRIQQELPPAWRELVKWPMAIARGEIKNMEWNERCNNAWSP